MRRDSTPESPDQPTASPSRRAAILVLIKSLGLGGAERLLVDGLPYLDRERFDYRFAYLLPGKDFLAPRLEEAGFPVRCLTRGPSRNGPIRPGAGSTLRALTGAVPALWRLQTRERPALIHAHLPTAGILARLVARRRRIPVVYTEHNLQERYHPLTRWLNRVTYALNSHVLAVSHDVAESIRRHGMDRHTTVETLANGIPVAEVLAEARDLRDLRQELAIPADHLVVGTVAVFRRQKRLDDWLEVAARVAAARPDVFFLLVGHGPEEEGLRARIDSLGLRGRVRLPGFRADGRRLLALLDLYLMTSEFEGLPVALLEAMALGKPVVATAVGGIPEVVRHGKEGLLCPVGEVDRLAALVEELLQDERRRKDMGARGAQEIAASYQIGDRIRHIEEIYSRLLNAGRSP
jgi:glycosyltransferase involved in cell wall biosynthesis